jgi:hypothetical protein
LSDADADRWRLIDFERQVCGGTEDIVMLAFEKDDGTRPERRVPNGALPTSLLAALRREPYDDRRASWVVTGMSIGLDDSIEVSLIHTMSAVDLFVDGAMHEVALPPILASAFALPDRS